MVNVVCVNWGTKYGVNYTHRLYNMVKRNTNRDFDFYVLTDQVDRYPYYKTIELNTDEVGWWNKLQLFSNYSNKKLIDNINKVVNSQLIYHN